MSEGWLIEEDIVHKCGVSAAFVYSVLKAQYLESANFSATVEQITASVPYSHCCVEKALKKLVEAGLIDRTKKNRFDRGQIKVNV